MSAQRLNPVWAIVLVRTGQASVITLALHWLVRWPLTGPHALGLVLTPLLCVYFVFVFVGPWSWGLPITTRLRTREKVVALTFDDGPSLENTPRVLDALRAHGARATFFVLGEAVERHPELLRRIVAEGHRVGLHGYEHRAMTLMPSREVGREIARVRGAVAEACPGLAAPTLLRPPHGFKSLALPWAAGRAGCRLVAWSLNPRDYHARTAPDLSAEVVGRLRPGAIVLLHDGPGSAVVAEALPGILAGVQSRGFRCVRLGAEETQAGSVTASREGA